MEEAEGKAGDRRAPRTRLDRRGKCPLTGTEEPEALCDYPTGKSLRFIRNPVKPTE